MHVYHTWCVCRFPFPKREWFFFVLYLQSSTFYAKRNVWGRVCHPKAGSRGWDCKKRCFSGEKYNNKKGLLLRSMWVSMLLYRNLLLHIYTYCLYIVLPPFTWNVEKKVLSFLSFSLDHVFFGGGGSLGTASGNSTSSPKQPLAAAAWGRRRQQPHQGGRGRAPSNHPREGCRLPHNLTSTPGLFFTRHIPSHAHTLRKQRDIRFQYLVT